MEGNDLCPLCGWPYTQRDGDKMLCLECGNQWVPESKDPIT